MIFFGIFDTKFIDKNIFLFILNIKGRMITMNETLLYNLNIKKVYSIFTINTEKNKTMRRVNRPNWAIILKYEGETIYKSNGKTYISNANNIIVLPKGATYDWQCTKPGRYYTIEFDCDTTSEEIFSFPINSHEKILQLYKDSEYKKNINKSIYKLELLKNAYSILLLLLKEKHPTYTSLSKRQKIEPAVDFLVKHYTQSIKNDDLATLTGLSTIYFRKIFTECFGISPIAYLHSLRIKKAKEILRSDYQSISHIAESLGYPDVYDFSRTFKKHVGMSPMQYAKSYSTP